MIKEYIKKICQEVLKEEIESLYFPKEHKIKLVGKYDKSKMTVWKAIDLFGVSRLHFNITYVSMGTEKTTFYNFDDFSQFLEFLNNFTPEFSQFNGCQFRVYYQHPEFGAEHDETEVFTSSYSNKVYPSYELTKITNKIISFIKERPELLI